MSSSLSPAYSHSKIQTDKQTGTQKRIHTSTQHRSTQEHKHMDTNTPRIVFMIGF